MHCYFVRLKPDKQVRKEDDMKEINQGITLIAPPGLLCDYSFNAWDSSALTYF